MDPSCEGSSVVLRIHPVDTDPLRSPLTSNIPPDQQLRLPPPTLVSLQMNSPLSISFGVGCWEEEVIQESGWGTLSELPPTVLSPGKCVYDCLDTLWDWDWIKSDSLHTMYIESFLHPCWVVLDECLSAHNLQYLGWMDDVMEQQWPNKGLFIVWKIADMSSPSLWFISWTTTLKVRLLLFFLSPSYSMSFS